MRVSNVVNWFEIYVIDIDRARKFYESVLGVKMMDLPMPEGSTGQMVAFPWMEGAPNASGAIVKHDMGHPSPTGTLIYFECNDCSDELGRVEENGGTVIAPKFSIGEFGYCGIAMDTEGNSIGFHSRK